MILRICLLGLLIPFYAFTQKPLQSVTMKMVHDAQSSQARWSICAVDLNTGDTLSAYNSDVPLIGASINKLVSSAVALSELGVDHKATTEIILEGKMLANGTFDGDIRILGHGDVSLGSKFFNEQGEELKFLEDWCSAISQKGIKNITGNIIADGISFGAYDCPLGWVKEDMANYYGSGAYGLNFYDNILKLKFSAAGAGTTIKYVGSYPSDGHNSFRIGAKSANSSGENLNFYGTAFSYQRSVSGTMPANKTVEVRASMPDPERLLADIFLKQLQASGIRVNGSAVSARFSEEYRKSRSDTQLVYTQIGQSLEKIIFYTNHHSVNMFAEGNLLQLGAEKYGKGTYENSLRVIDEVFQQWQIGPCRVVDGSGLSRENRMSASQYVHLLTLQTNQEYYASYYRSLPIAGVSGTLKPVCRGQAAQGKMHAKSGSMRGIRAYAGYVESADGHQIAFAIIANGFNISTKSMITKMEPFFNSLATYRAQPK